MSFVKFQLYAEEGMQEWVQGEKHLFGICNKKTTTEVCLLTCC
jgi:hypothetical protein